MSSSEEDTMNDRITIEGRDGAFSAHIARPKASLASAVVVLHEAEKETSPPWYLVMGQLAHYPVEKYGRVAQPSEWFAFDGFAVGVPRLRGFCEGGVLDLDFQARPIGEISSESCLSPTAQKTPAAGCPLCPPRRYIPNRRRACHPRLWDPELPWSRPSLRRRSRS
jgi:hypothetical protein